MIIKKNKKGVIFQDKLFNTIIIIVVVALNVKSFDDVNVWFDVSVTPTPQQAKKLLILTDQTTLTATDKLTESEITKIGKAVTSNLEDDPIGGGRGLVIDITE